MDKEAFHSVANRGTGGLGVFHDGMKAITGDELSQMSDEELEKELANWGRKGVDIQRYKGLGEMSSEQLWQTTMNPEKRTLLQVQLDDAMEADGIFSTLMGENPELRRQFIEENANLVKDLDI